MPVEKTLAKSGIVLRLIPAGEFTMGSPISEQDAVVESTPADRRADVREWVANETQHKVTLTKSFYCYGNDLDSSMANFDANYPYGKWVIADF